jgi:hypothetical protein
MTYPSNHRPVEPVMRALSSENEATTRVVFIFYSVLLLISLTLSLAAFHQLEVERLEQRGQRTSFECYDVAALDQCAYVETVYCGRP